MNVTESSFLPRLDLGQPCLWVPHVTWTHWVAHLPRAGHRTLLPPSNIRWSRLPRLTRLSGEATAEV